MPPQRLKLKQASAILKIRPKELQNLVQFGVVRPRRVRNTYLFDANTLLAAKVAFCLKEYFGTRTSILASLMTAFLNAEKRFLASNPKYIVFQCWGAEEGEPVKLGVPFRAWGAQIEERLSRVELYRDLPPGRKRRGWKKEFLKSLANAAKDLGGVSEQEILGAVRVYRKPSRTPEIIVAAEN